MWEVTYTITPDRGYFDATEPLMWDADIWLEAIHSIEFLSDGTVAIVYEVSGDVDRFVVALEEAQFRELDFTVTSESDPLVIQIRFTPDEILERLFSIQQSFGVSMQFPLKYVGYDPAILEVTEVGAREELRQRIQDTREVASVDVRGFSPYEPGTEQLFRELTDRQQEVLTAAVETGYYRTPREATQEDLADELSCSTSNVGQHLRRIESHLANAVLSDGKTTEPYESEPPVTTPE